MHTAVSTNSRIFIEFPSSTEAAQAMKRRGFYHRLAALPFRKAAETTEALSILRDKIIVAAGHAYAFRDMDAVEAISQALLSFPPCWKLQQVGQYYHALGLLRGRCQNKSMARAILEEITDGERHPYQPRAMLSIGTLLANRGDLSSAFQSYNQAATSSSRADHNTYFQAHQARAVLMTIDGKHEVALSLLEQLYPMLRYVAAEDPLSYYQYWNSAALMLAHNGKFKEAIRASRITLASPYAVAYPEWKDTWNDIKRDAASVASKRSTIIVPFGPADLSGVASLNEHQAKADWSTREGGDNSRPENEAQPVPSKVWDIQTRTPLAQSSPAVGRKENPHLLISLTTGGHTDIIFDDSISGSDEKRVVEFAEDLRTSREK